MNNQPITNKTPKVRFMETAANIHKHRALVDSEDFQRGVDFALLQYQLDLANQISDGNSAVGVGLRIKGAQEFLFTLRNLSEMPKIAGPVRVLDNLTEPK